MIAKFIKSKRMVALVLFSVALASFSIVRLTKTNPISALEKLGAGITRSSGRSNSVVSVNLSGKYVTDDHLVHLNSFRRLIFLDLSNTQITDAGLVHIKGLTKLTHLYLRDTQITDAGLVHLKGLTQLESLDLRDTQVTDSSLVHLKDMTQLKTLNLRDTQVTNKARQEFRSAIPALSLQDATKAATKEYKGMSQLTDSGLADLDLEDMPQLRTLNLSDTRVTDKGRQELLSTLQDQSSLPRIPKMDPKLMERYGLLPKGKSEK